MAENGGLDGEPLPNSHKPIKPDFFPWSKASAARHRGARRLLSACEPGEAAAGGGVSPLLCEAKAAGGRSLKTVTEPREALKLFIVRLK